MATLLRFSSKDVYKAFTSSANIDKSNKDKFLAEDTNSNENDLSEPTVERLAVILENYLEKKFDLSVKFHVNDSYFQLIKGDFLSFTYIEFYNTLPNYILQFEVDVIYKPLKKEGLTLMPEETKAIFGLIGKVAFAGTEWVVSKKYIEVGTCTLDVSFHSIMI